MITPELTTEYVYNNLTLLRFDLPVGIFQTTNFLKREKYLYPILKLKVLKNDFCDKY